MDKASHGSIMAAIFGQTGEGQAGDVTKGLKDALAKIPKDATDYNERAAKAVQGAWQRAAYEINNNVQTVQANLNPALWQLQSNLSAVNGELDLLGKEDAIKKQEAQVEGVVAAAKREAAEFKRSSEVMHRVMEEMKRDAEEQERLDQRISNAEAAAAVANQNYADEIAAGNRKRVEEQVRVQQEGYNEDLSMAIKTAEEKEKAKTQAAKSSSSSSGEIAAIQAEVKEEVDAYQTRLTNLDKFSKDYENKVKELRDKIKQTEQKGNDETVQIYQKKAETIKKVEDKIADEVGRSVAKCIVEQKSMGQAAKQIGQKMQVCQLFCVNGQVLFLGMGARGKGASSPSLAQRL
jgi:chromosome segregation ATPase